MSVGEATDASTPLLVDAFLGRIAAAASLVVSSTRNLFLNTILAAAVASVRRRRRSRRRRRLSVHLAKAVQPHPRSSTLSPSVTSTLSAIVLFGVYVLILLSSVMCGCRGAALVVDPINGAPAAAFVAGVSAGGGSSLATAVDNGSSIAEDYYDDLYDTSSHELAKDKVLDPAEVAARARRALRSWESPFTEKSNDSCLMSRKGEYLMIYADGEVRSADDLAKAWQYCRLEVSTSSPAARRFKGLRSDRFLCMNKNGRLFGSRSVDRPGCEFVETVEGYFSTFFSPERNRLMALNAPGPVEGTPESRNNSRASFLLLATPPRDDPMMQPENRNGLERERRRGLYLQRCRRFIKRRQKSNNPLDAMKNLPTFCTSRMMPGLLESLLNETQQQSTEPSVAPAAIGGMVAAGPPSTVPTTSAKKGKESAGAQVTGSGSETGDNKRQRRPHKGRHKKKNQVAKGDGTGAAVSTGKKASSELTDLERERRRRRKRRRRKERRRKEKRLKSKQPGGTTVDAKVDPSSKEAKSKAPAEDGSRRPHRRHHHGKGRRKNKKSQNAGEKADVSTENKQQAKL